MRGNTIRQLVILGLLFVSPAHAQTQSKDTSPTISMDVTEAYLEDVLKLLSKQAGMNFAASEAARDKKVTLYFDRVPISDALDTILKANHLALIPKEGKNIFLVDESGAPKISTVTRIYRLRYARVVPMAGEVTKTFGLTGSLISETFKSSSGTSGTSGPVGGGGGAAPAGGAGGTAGAAATGGTGGTTEQGGGLVQIVKFLLTEHGSVVSDPRTNSLIVTDIPEQMTLIDETIAKLDVMPKQIYLEAEVLEVTMDTLRRIGLEYGDSTGQIGHYTGPQRSTFFPFSKGLFDRRIVNDFGALTLEAPVSRLGGVFFNDASVLFKLLATEKDVKFLARPRLLTLSSEVAEIRIVSEDVTGLTSTAQSQTGTITSQPERTTVGTILRVTPMVNDDNRYVTMIIEPEVSRVLQSSLFPNFLNPSRRVARTSVMVPSGGTAMIAGLISDQSNNSARRLPGLGDLPLLGLPFKRTEMERQNTEILLFITPHILKDDSTRTKLTFAKEREQVPLNSREEQALQDHRKRILKERGITQTIDSIAW